eukprot:246364-Rhodomonas_salina.3
MKGRGRRKREGFADVVRVKRGLSREERGREEARHGRSRRASRGVGWRAGAEGQRAAGGGSGTCL